MRPWMSRILLTAAVFGACWIAAILFWRDNNRLPSDLHMVQALLALPLAVLLSIWLGKKMLLARTADPAMDSATQPAPGSNAPAPARQRGRVFDIVASAMRMRNGESPEELAEAISSNTARCELDPELSDDDGYPVMSGRIDSVDDIALQEAMTAWLLEQGITEPNFSSEQWRALALGSAVVSELAQHAVMHKLLPDYAQAAPAARATLPFPALQLLHILPSSWNKEQREAAAQWFLQLIEQQGWPAERLALSTASEPKDSTAFSLIDQLSQQSGRVPFLAIVMACDSYIGDDSVRDWSERRLLLTARNPHGQIPGEGAAGLLLADSAQALLLDAATAAQLHGACDGMRASSADGNGRVCTELLTKLSKEALSVSETDAARISLVTADTDHRSSRIAELMGMANATLPQLDLSSQVMSVAACCGSAGATASIAALALAQHDAAANAGHVLCVSNQDPFQRCALVVRPKSAPQS
jgi:hypothetical protein